MQCVLKSDAPSGQNFTALVENIEPDKFFQCSQNHKQISWEATLIKLFKKIREVMSRKSQKIVNEWITCHQMWSGRIRLSGCSSRHSSYISNSPVWLCLIFQPLFSLRSMKLKTHLFNSPFLLSLYSPRLSQDWYIRYWPSFVFSSHTHFNIIYRQYLCCLKCKCLWISGH